MVSVLHIVPRICRGGGTASPLNIARQLQARGSSNHLFVSLAKAEPEIARAFGEEGFPIIDNPRFDELRQIFSDVDIVQLDWWNTPEIARLLSQQLPPTRLVLWSVVTGDAPPHVISSELLGSVDHFVACSPYSMELPTVRNQANAEKIEFIHIPANFDRLKNLGKKEHDGFNVGYVGTIDYAKMHRNYLSMCKGINVPEAKFLVCGHGRSIVDLKTQVEKENLKDRFRFYGYVENIADVISEMDVYGYPLNENTFAAAELNLQEAMWSGLPIVSSPYGGVPYLIQHEETGILVDNEKDYQLAIEHLYHHPDERERLGQNAATHARKNFDPKISANRFEDLYVELVQRPKTSKPPIFAKGSSHSSTTALTGAELLIGSIGDFAVALRSSQEGHDLAKAIKSDKAIAESNDLFHQGCIVQFLHAHPTDPWLHFWNGLIHWQRGNFMDAHDSWSMSIRYALGEQRVFYYMSHVAEMEQTPFAREKLLQIRREAERKLSGGSDASSPWEMLLLDPALEHDGEVVEELDGFLKSQPQIIYPELELSQQLEKAFERAKSRPVYLWGAGVAGQKAKTAMDGLDMEPRGFIDRSQKLDAQVQRLPVFSPKILNEEKSAFVLICTMYYRQVAEELKALGFNPFEDFLALHIQ